MDIKTQKSLILDKLRNDTVLTADLKEKFKKQIEKMSDEEFVVFIESMKGIKNEKNLKEKIKLVREMQKKEHKNFMQKVNDFFKKTTKYESKKQAEEDDLKSKAILKKIKYL